MFLLIWERQITVHPGSLGGFCELPLRVDFALIVFAYIAEC